MTDENTDEKRKIKEKALMDLGEELHKGLTHSDSDVNEFTVTYKGKKRKLSSGYDIEITKVTVNQFSSRFIRNIKEYIENDIND